MRERVRPGDHRLCGQRLRRPAVRHLRRHDAPEVLLDPHDVDDLKAGADFRHAQRAAIATGAERERARSRGQEQWPGERRQALADAEPQLQGRPEGLRAGGQLVLLALPVADDERRLGRDDDPLGAGGEEYAHLVQVRLAERRARVVVVDDPVVGPAVEGVTVGAVLRHSDPMPPAVAREEDRRQRLGPLDAVRGRGVCPQLVRVAGRGACCEPQRGENRCCEFGDVHRTGPRPGGAIRLRPDAAAGEP
jgi:hypothetical protein